MRIWNFTTHGQATGISPASPSPQTTITNIPGSVLPQVDAMSWLIYWSDVQPFAANTGTSVDLSPDVSGDFSAWAALKTAGRVLTIYGPGIRTTGRTINSITGTSKCTISANATTALGAGAGTFTVFAWDQVDDCLFQANTVGLKSVIRLQAGVRSPLWAMTNPNPYVVPTGGNITPGMPIPWSSQFTTNYGAMIAKAGLRYDGDVRLEAVATSGGGFGGEGSMGQWPASGIYPTGWLNSADSGWKPGGFDFSGQAPVGATVALAEADFDTKIKGAWHTIWSNWKAAFPTTLLVANTDEPLGQAAGVSIMYALRDDAILNHGHNRIQVGNAFGGTSSRSPSGSEWLLGVDCNSHGYSISGQQWLKAAQSMYYGTGSPASPNPDTGTAVNSEDWFDKMGATATALGLDAIELYNADIIGGITSSTSTTFAATYANDSTAPFGASATAHAYETIEGTDGSVAVVAETGNTSSRLLLLGAQSSGTPTYGAATVTDGVGGGGWRVDAFKGLPVVAGTKTGTVSSNTANKLTLTANWTGGTPSAVGFTVGLWANITPGSVSTAPPASGTVFTVGSYLADIQTLSATVSSGGTAPYGRLL